MNVQDWGSREVLNWLQLSGFGNYAAPFEEHEITGDILIELDRETLHDLGLRSVGRRLMFLRAIRNLREQHGLPVHDDEAQPVQQYQQLSTSNSSSPPPNDEGGVRTTPTTGGPLPSPLSSDEYRKVKRAIQERDSQIKILTQEVQRLSMLASASASGTGTPTSPAGPFYASTPTTMPGYAGGTTAPTPTTSIRSPSLSVPPAPPAMLHRRGHSSSSLTSVMNPPPAASPPAPKKSDNKNFRLSRNDRCYDVLPRVMEKYKIEGDWRDYALYIKYGSKDNRKERRVEHDEIVESILGPLKDQSPEFKLKHNKHGNYKTIRR